MKEKLCVITGATSGIGRATALALGAMGADLVLLGRNRAAGSSVVSRITRLPQAGKVEFLRTDLSVQSDVRAAASAIAQHGRPVDVLVNNAGARFDRYAKSADGYELTLATNHLGHFLLTGLLLDRILQADHGRVITIASGSHGSAAADGRWELEAAAYDRRQAYAKSKLANVVFAYELARRLEGTRAVSCAVDPGGVASNFGRNNGLQGWARHLLSHALHWELISPRTAAQTIVWLASSPDIPGANGGYYHRMNRVRSSPVSYDTDAARELWVLSLASTGLAGETKVPCLLTKP